MANDVSKVTAGKPKVAGAIYRGSTSLSLPTSASAELAEGFAHLGYVSDDGVTNALSMGNVHRAWGGDPVLVDDDKDEFSFTLIETMNLEAMKARFGDGAVSGTLSSGITVSVGDSDSTAKAWVIDMVLKGGGLKRLVIPNGVVTKKENIVYKDDEVTGYGITVTAGRDSSGNTHYEYTISPAPTQSSSVT